MTYNDDRVSEVARFHNMLTTKFKLSPIIFNLLYIVFTELKALENYDLNVIYSILQFE